MDLPDCPPGAEGYQDSVTEQPKKLPIEDTSTKAEQEFLDHLNSLKIKLEDGSTAGMVERRGRDISGKWIYLCYPCAAMCSGESILQTHISGKKHKTKLSLRNTWPKSIFEEHPYIVNEKGGISSKNATTSASEKVLAKMAEEVDLHNKPPSELDLQYNKYRNIGCHIQESLDLVKAPLLGVEYLIEHPPEQAHYEPSYICVLCSKQGHPRTIINHLTGFWHRYNYLIRHYQKACALLAPYRGQTKYREGVSVIMNRLAQRVEDKFGRLRPVNIDKEEYEKDKERIHQWIFKSHHFSELNGPTFEEVVDIDLINTLNKSNESSMNKIARGRDPSPPVVAAPSKPRFNSGRQGRRALSSEALSDVSDEHNPRRPFERDNRYKDRYDARNKPRFEPYHDRRRGDSPFRSRYALKNAADNKNKPNEKEKQKPPNHEYKLKLAEEKRMAAEESAKKTLAYHEKNPEKHPLYPEEWKKFWNRRYKEIQAEGKDPSKHDFKPEWIVFWTGRMKELHDEELRVNVVEIYRKLCLSPPNMSRRLEEPKPSLERERRRSSERQRSSERRRSPYRRKSAERHREPERRREPDRRREPERREPERRRSPEYRRERRSPDFPRRHSPLRHLRTRSRSPAPRARSPARTHITLESVRRSRSPLSRRQEAMRNRSPLHHGPASHTVMISDDELKPDEGLSPWNSDNDLESLGSLPDAAPPLERAASRSESMVSSRASRPRRFIPDYPTGRGAEPQDLGPAENVVATLRLLVALEDYLGSLGPKIVDLLTEALKMEKDKANASEELLERESALVLIETAKEKLKGAAQAGLVAGGAAAAVRAAVVRAAATLHEADTRAKKKQEQPAVVRPQASAVVRPQANAPPASAGRRKRKSHRERYRDKMLRLGLQSKAKPAASVPVAGVGEVDRAQIAQQMAAALVAQGKTDVSSEELAQLVDAVVGMAEAKKREAEVKKKVAARAQADQQARPPPPARASTASTASALQMLQSAYDENDKKIEKEDAPDAMDGLSDSDLETLLKNFNELSAEEQHSLIAYLKKLEAREPQRVERLRQYVSAAATTAPQQDEPAPVAKADVKLVTIESDDDDDYTVEEVFKSATQKVKENQIRQEMEIVKKSLEEAKPVEKEESTPSVSIPSIDLTKNLSSASDLFALVQASLQTVAASVPPPAAPEVVTSNTQPRSFGDPEQPQADTPKSLLDMPARNMQQSNFGNQSYNAPNQSNFGGNRNVPNNSPWENNAMGDSNMSDNMGDNDMMIDNDSNMMGDNSMMRDNSMQRDLMQDNRPGLLGRGPSNFGQQNNFNQGPRANFMNGRMQDNYDTRPAMNQPFGNTGNNPPFGNQQFGNNQGNQPFGNNQGNQPFGNNQGNQPFGNNQANQPFGNNQGSQPFGNNQGSQPFGNNQGNQPFGNNQGNQSFGNQGNKQFGNQSFGNQGNQPFGNKGNQPFGNQGNQQFGNQGNQQYGNQGKQQFGNRGNQQFGGNFGGNQGGNFRGRGGGRGNFGGRGRGRGRGF